MCENEKGEKNKILILIMAVAAVIIYQIVANPYIGIANNGDFQRIMSPSAVEYIENPWLEENRSDYFFGYITNAFKVTTPQKTGWISPYQGNIILSLVVNKLLSKTGAYDIRSLGITNMLIYLFGIGIILYRIKKENNKYIRVFLSIWTCILAVDAYVIQYMNSFYCEIGTVNACLIFYGCMSLLLDCKFEGRHIIYLYIFACISGLVAVTMKQQDILCIIPTVSLLLIGLNQKVIAGIKSGRKIMISTFGVIIVVLILATFVRANTGLGNIGCCNVIFQDMMTESKNPTEHLKRIGFDNQQITEIQTAFGESVFEENGSEIYKKYGDKFSYLAELEIIVYEPEILMRMIKERSKNLFSSDDGLGNFTKEAGLEGGKKSEAFRWWSKIKEKIYKNCFTFYCLVILCAAVMSLVILKRNKKTNYIVLAMCVSNVLRFFTCILGDSSLGDRKHFFVTNIEFDVIFFYVVANVFWGILYIYNKLKVLRLGGVQK